MTSPIRPVSPAGCCDSCTVRVEPAARPSLPRSIAWLQTITIGWMLVECGVALTAAFNSHSVALLAFGSDSLVELFSAFIVLAQFFPRFRLRKDHAERAAAVLLFVLAATVACIAALSFHGRTEASGAGIAITAAALVVMPALAWMKRREARARGDGALAADATQSATCAYLAAVTLVGLGANAIWHTGWVDPAAALAAVPILIVEGVRTWRGEGCGCGH